MYRCKDSLVSNEHKLAIFNPHTLSPVHVDSDKIMACFIDPAIKTCAIRIAEKNFTTGKIRTVFQRIYDFSADVSFDCNTQGTDPYISCFNEMHALSPFLIMCHYIVMEYQSVVASYQVIRFSQLLNSTIMNIVKDKGHRPLIIEIDPKLKTSMFKLPRMKKPQLKKECAKIAIQILINRGEQFIADRIAELAKNDDHGDTVCYDDMWWRILQEKPTLLRLPDMGKFESKKCRVLQFDL